MIDLAIIGARSGSKRILNKNIVDLGGKPLISWTIKAALLSGSFKRVVVSTDSEEIARHAENEGAEVPFLRPKFLSLDNTSSIDVIKYVINKTGSTGNAALLQPTSPFRNAEHIKEACSKFLGSSASSLISLTKTEPLSWKYYLKEGELISSVSDSNILNGKKNKKENIFLVNGAIYLFKISDLLLSNTLFFSNTIGYEMSKIDSQDIDTMEDLEICRGIVSTKVKKY